MGESGFGLEPERQEGKCNATTLYDFAVANWYLESATNSTEK